MGKDHWTTEEYRRFVETGKEPSHSTENRPLPFSKASDSALYRTAEQEPDVRKSKFGNRKAEEDGISFDSLHERNVYRWLKARKMRGELKWVFVHVPFRFMSGVVYWADFMTIRADGTVEAVWDAKSEITAKNSGYVIKKKDFEGRVGHHRV